ncbi:hypothetical protein K663_03535 [Sphingobium sp. MI1205]|nr:hypothetical protein K663_03535 [Sphingobium sp. MI1205]
MIIVYFRLGGAEGLEDVDEFADQVPEAADVALANLLEHGLEAWERFLDRVEVRALGRQEA